MSFFFFETETHQKMAGLVGLIKNKPKPVANVSDNNPYAMAMCIPAETDRIFDGELKLLLMDGLLQFLLFPLSVVSTLRAGRA